MAGHEGNSFHNITWLETSTDGPNTRCPIIDNSNQSQPYQPRMRYLPNKREALQAHMQKVHKLGNAQTDTSYYIFFLIWQKLWSMPAPFTSEKRRLSNAGLAQSTTKNMLSVSSSPTALLAPSTPAKTVRSTSSQGASFPS